MIAVIIVVVIGILAAFVCGFYCGYLKREGEPPPVSIPVIENIASGIKEKKQKPTKEDNKANGFFN